MNYFELNINEEPNNISNIYSNNTIYLINYPENKKVAVSIGQP